MSSESKPPSAPPPPRSEKPGGERSPVPKKFRFSLLYVLIAILCILTIQQLLTPRATELSYDQFLYCLRQGYVEWVLLGDDQYTGEILVPPGAPKPPGWRKYEAGREEAAREGARGGKERAEEPKEETSSGEPAGKDGLGSPQTEPAGEAAPPANKGPDPRVTGPPFGKSLPWSTETEPRRFRFSVVPARSPEHEKELIAELERLGVPFKNKPPSGFWPSVLVYMIPFLLLIGFWFLLMRQTGQIGRNALSFGRSRAKLYAEKQDVTFDDVAGCDEAKEELREVVDFLRSPKKYQSLGGRMPKGILLVGPPGTGKTLLARAVAGESKVPFFSLSGSEFVEMFVGVGAARVRDLFQQAKSRAPCIIFIDELDAVGRHRGAGLGGGHDEREQTLNQLLVEMDGFDTTQGVILLAATNRPDVLDPALLRPGRFDRQIVIDAPDAKGRKAILEVHARGKPFAPDVNFDVVAANTPGFTGADLANVINEAALLAARRGLKEIRQAEIDEAVERVIAGPERKSRRLGEEERRRVAYHESGHALVAALSEHADPVRKISIVPRGHAALGYTMQSPADDRYLSTKSVLIDKLKSLLAGRAAELLVFNELSSGAADDLQRATQIARTMVCRLGMSERLGPVTYGREEHQVFLGRDFAQEDRNYSEKTAEEIDREVRSIIEEANAAAMRILERHRECLDHIAETLLEREVIQGQELEEILKRELCREKESRDTEAARGEGRGRDVTREETAAGKPLSS